MGEDADGDGKVDCCEHIEYAWNALLGPSFTQEDTYKMIKKAYGEKVAAPYKPAPKPRKSLLKEVEGDVAAVEQEVERDGKLAGNVFKEKATEVGRKMSVLMKLNSGDKGAASEKAMV